MLRVPVLAVVLGIAFLTAALPAEAKKPRHPWAHVTRAPLPVPMPEILHEACPGAGEELAGCYFAPGNADVSGRVFARGAVFVTPGTGRFTKLHELGHSFDESMMDAGERDEFTRIRHERDLLWTWSDQVGDLLIQSFNTPAEELADAYANCRMQRTPWDAWSASSDYYPTPREHHRVCRLIARASLDAGAPVSPDGDR